MSQTSDGNRGPAFREHLRPEDAINSTTNAVSAFGEDIADDAYSVSDMSHYDDDKTERRGGQRQKAAFNKKRMKKFIERQGSVYIDEVPAESTHNLHTDQRVNGKEKEKGGSSSSPEPSEGTGATSGDSEDSDVTICTYASFAQSKFQVKTTHSYTCSALGQPLLAPEDRNTSLAALASWVTILRIMGDLPDEDLGDTLLVSGSKESVVSRVKAGFTTKYTKKDLEDAQKKYSDLFKEPAGTNMRSVPFLSCAGDNMLDKVQMVCSMGIYKPKMRDELYCQLCKQLTNNPSRNSQVRGWLLLSLFVATFAPSEKFALSLQSFLMDGPEEFTEKIDKQLRRTCCVGTRGYPPCWLEFQAAKNGKPVMVPVTFMNNNRILCEVDAATTAFELVRMICERLGIEDSIGFSIFISVQSKISCLGNGTHRILDAITEGEQQAKAMGIRESNAAWRLYFRKEFFSPWYAPGKNFVGTDLIYQQIRRGISMGEYMMDKEDSMVQVIARVFLVEHYKDTDFQDLSPFINTFVPENILDRRPVEYYKEKVLQLYAETDLKKGNYTVKELKVEVVSFALDNFMLMFTRYYEATKVTASGVQMVDVLVGLSHIGVVILGPDDKLKKGIHFCEIAHVHKSKNHVTLYLIGQDDCVITTQHVDDFHKNIVSFLRGLRQRSRFAIATHEVTQIDCPTGKNVVKGDLLKLLKPAEECLDTERPMEVVNLRTQATCEVPAQILHVLPAVYKIEDSLAAKLVSTYQKDAKSFMVEDAEKFKTLQQFAKSHFRPAGEGAVTKFLSKASFKKDKMEGLWKYSKDALKRPLLKRTCIREDIKQLACHSFTSTQTFMVNLIINDELTNYMLCFDWILEPARRNKYLRDEIFCQIIKQLTCNPNKSSEDHGWVLLTLLTSLTTPNRDIADVCRGFIKSSPHPLARTCLKNMHVNQQRAACRLYSSHFQEYTMVIRHQPNIRLQVALPNQTVQTVEVTSSTRIFEIKKWVAKRIGLKHFQEYSLFITTKNKVQSLPDKGYYFDCLSHAETYLFKSRRKSNIASTPPFIIVMMKKIWVNVQPGQDKVADNIFHFWQEMGNYLTGYHQLSHEENIQLSALLYRSHFGDSAENFAKFKQMERQLLPQGALKDKSIQEIQDLVKAEYDLNAGMQEVDAKLKFLEQLSKLPVYGSVFFEVRQRHSQSLSRNCLVAINMAGVHIIDRDTKSVVKTYEFRVIPNWAYDSMSFTFIFNDAGSTGKLLVETTVGHNMDDLIMSYVVWYMNSQMRNKYGYMLDEAGESIC